MRKVGIDGTISYRGRVVSLGKAFRRERVAVRPTTEDGVMKVFFGVHEILTFDLRIRDGGPAAAGPPEPM